MNFSLRNENANYVNNLGILNKIDKNNKSKIAESVGTIVSAIIDAKTDTNTTLTTKSGVTFETDGNVRGEVGNEAFFEIIGTKDGQTTLKQVFPEQSNFRKELLKQKSTLDDKELMSKSGWALPKEGEFTTKEQAAAEAAKEREKAQAAAAKIRQQVGTIVNNASSAAMSELLASGVSLDKISLEELNNLVEVVKKNPFIKAADTSTKKPNMDIAKNALLSQNLPVNSKNLQIINSAIDNFRNVQEISDSSTVSLVKNGNEVSIKNIYRFANTAGHPAAPFDENILPELESFMKSEGIELNAENIDTAKMLVSNNIELTNKNVEKAVFLRNKIKTIALENFANEAAKNLKNGQKSTDIDLIKLSLNPKNNTTEIAEKEDLISDYVTLIEDMPALEQLSPAVLAQKGLTATLSELQTEAHNPPPISQAAPLSESETRTAFTVKRQILELSIKLTYETAARLVTKNIKISAVTLEAALEQVNAAEKDYFASTLTTFSANNPQNAESMDKIYSVLRSLPFSGIDYHSLLSTEGGTLRSFSFSSTKIDESALISHDRKKAIQDYEAMLIAPDKRFGDSFQKAEDQLSHILQNLGFSDEADNIKAARILSINGLEITAERLLAVKTANQKLEAIQSSLKPAVAAKMLAEGINPLDMSLDDILRYIDKFNDEKGENMQERLSRYILEAMRNGTVTEQNKRSILAIYRALHKIAADGFASVGTALAAERELSLGNLLKMSKIYDKTLKNHKNFNFSIDDTTGSPTLSIPENNIEYLLNKTYNETLIRNFVEKAPPRPLDRIMSENPNISDTPLAQLIQQLTEAQEKNDINRINSELERVQSLYDTPPHAASFLERNGIPLTPANIDILKKLLKERNYVSKTLRETSKIAEIEKLFPTITGLREFLSASPDYEQRLTALQTSEDLSAEDLTKIDDAKRALNFKNKIAEVFDKKITNKNGFFRSSPVNFGGKLTDIDMYVLNENISTKAETTIYMSLSTTFGNVTAEVRASRTTKTAQIKIASPSASLFAEYANLLADFVKKSGFTLTNAQFTEDGKADKSALEDALYGDF